MTYLNATDPNISVYVDASAGSGKTKLLVDRIVRMLIYGIIPSKILCITFTNAAAEEMYDRLQSRLISFLTMGEEELKIVLFELNGYIPTTTIIHRARSLFGIFIKNKPNIQTLHGFCAKILQKMHIININDDLNNKVAKIIDDDEKDTLLRESFNDIITTNDQYEIESSLRVILKQYEPSYVFDLICDFWNKISTANNEQFFSLINCDVNLGIYGLLKETMYNFFQINSNKSTHDLINDYLNSLDEIILQKTITLLAQDNITGKAAAESIKAFLESKDHTSFYGYVSIFLTNDYKPRVRLPISTKLAKQSLEIQEFLLSEQSNIYLIIEKINCYSAAEVNAAFSILSYAVLKRFNDKKKINNLFEYSDLIRHTINLITSSDDKMTLLYSIDLSISHIMIDEAQDLSATQWSLIKAISDDFFAGFGTTQQNRTIFIVGDFKQAIFGFQGAAPHIFQNIKKFYREKVIGAGKQWYELQLDTCFRCAPEILKIVDIICNQKESQEGFDAENLVITHNSIQDNGFGQVQLHEVDISNCKTTEKPAWYIPTEVIPPEKEQDISALIAEKIAYIIHQWLKIERKYGPQNIIIKPQDILILLRKRSKLQDSLVSELNTLSIPISNLAARAFGHSIYIYDLLAALQFVRQPFDDMNLASLLKSPSFNISDLELFKLCHDRQKSLWEVVQLTKQSELLNQMLQNAEILDLYEFFTWYILDIYKYTNDETTRFLDYILHYQYTTKKVNVSYDGFMIWLHKLLTQKQQKPYDNKSIRITTVHSAKGLEAPIVILADAGLSDTTAIARFAHENDIFILNTKNSPKISQDVFMRYNKKSAKENIRLLYVAMTRPKYELHVFGTNKQSSTWYNIIKNALNH